MKMRWIACALVVVLLLGAASRDLLADPVRTLPGLDSITFWERTGPGPTPYTFGVNSAQLTTTLTDPLGGANNDMVGWAPFEYYDVYYSNADGTFNVNGEYLTISGIFTLALPFGGGLNLAEIELNYSGGGSPEYGNYVASFSALGDNAVPSTVGLAIDGNLQTHTTMGNTTGASSRLRLTLGFFSSSGPVPPAVPEPTTLALFGLGAGVLALRRRKRSIG